MTDTSKPLSVTRKDDRQKMANIIFNIANECGAKATIAHVAPREIWVKVEGPRGLNCTFDFDGTSSQPNVFVNAWNTITYKLQKEPARLYHFPGGEPNPYHHRKCTTVCRGFDTLADHVRAVLNSANDGWIFEKEPPR